MKVKVCGITKVEDLEPLAKLEVDFVGFILYSESKRFAEKNLKSLAEISLKLKIKRAGVFVNDRPERVAQISKEHKLDFVQLHGNEPPDYCEKIRQSVKVIKAFNIDESFDFSRLKAYNTSCDYFLFDAKGKLPGGNSITFNWSFLKQYEMDKPFFLSGGISPSHIEQLQSFRHPSHFAIDINSGFETSPGVKDTKMIEAFLKKLKLKTAT